MSVGRRVALLGSYAPSLVNFRATLIEALVADGHQVTALAPDIDPDTAGRLRSMGAIPRSISLSNTTLDPRATWRSGRALERILREIAPQTLISYTIKPVTLGSLAAYRAGIPNIVALVTGLGYAFTAGGGARRRISRIAASHLYRRALARATAIIFQNPDDRDDFARLRLFAPDAPVHLVNGSGVALDHYAPVALPGHASFLMIARLLGDKGVREYGAAARLLRQRFPDVTVALAGYLDASPDSISQSELDALVADGVTFLGRLDDVRPALARASVYVLPSYREGTPRSVLEAMAMGRPIITTDAPGCRQTIEDGVSGYLVPPRDTGALAAAMTRFVEHPERRTAMGMAALARVRDRFDAVRVTDATLRAAGLRA